MANICLLLLVIYPILIESAVDLGACSSNPCLNSGICTSLQNSFICTCINGHIGVYCERRAEECTFSDSLRCINGRCKINPNGASTCECNANYGGVNCDIKLNTCVYTSCENGGTCVDTANGFKCNCPAGFKGKNCQVKEMQTAKCLDSCRNISAGTQGGKCWHKRSEVVKVGWGYEHSLCNSKQSCFDMPTTSVEYVDVQIKPVQAQPNDTLVFLTDIDAALYNHTFVPHVIPVEAMSSESFTQCNMTHAIQIANMSAVKGGELVVNSSYLKTGTQYFIANVNALHRCEFGLRLNVTIKDSLCTDPAMPSRKLCHGQGRCYTDFTQSSFQCSCCDGYIGKYCQTEDPCFMKPCKNNGKCNVITDLNGETSFRCQCISGFKGFNCNQTIDHCENSPCSNGGICTSSHMGFSCSCASGFSGTTCAVNENQCVPNPCQNGGTCTDGDNSFTCKCAKGFKDNSLACIDHGNNVTCSCIHGYAGINCGVNVDECAGNPCLNAGKCIDQLNAFECRCPKGVSGARCQVVTAKTTSTSKPSSTQMPKTDDIATTKIPAQGLEVTLDLQLLTENCSRLQGKKALGILARSIFSIISDACDCLPWNGVIKGEESLVRCSDDVSGKFVTKLKLKDDKEKELIFCSLLAKIEKGHVPTTDHHTYIVGINTNTAFCDKSTWGKGPGPAATDSPSHRIGIITGSVVGAIVLVVIFAFVSLKFRNRAVREVKESDPDDVKSYLNFIYQSDVEMTSPRSAWNTPVLEHNPNHLKYVIKKNPKIATAETSFSIDNPGGKTSSI
eukprot:gene11229-12408_t